MLNFPVHTLETATAASKARLETSQQSYGSIPNIHGVMAGSAGLGFQQLRGYPPSRQRLHSL
jgi:hypothetical protein